MGEARTLTAKLPWNAASAITFSSSDPKVATVDDQGNVVAVKRGAARIIASTYNGQQAVCKVRVRRAPRSISINPGVLSLWVGETFELEPVLSRNSVGEYSYSISDDAVASISGNTLTALSPGDATVTVTTYNGKAAEMSVQVARKPVYRALLVGETSFPGTGLGALPARKDVGLMKSMLDSVQGPAAVDWSWLEMLATWVMGWLKLLT